MLVLLEGRTKHRRLAPVIHQFSYPVVYVVVPVSADSDPNKTHRLGPWVSVRERDYLPPADASSQQQENLYARLCRFLPTSFETRTMSAWLVTMPRWLGYAFNPVSVYFVLTAKEQADKLSKSSQTSNQSNSNGKLEWKFAILEVGNTFGERHIYTLPVDQGRPSNRLNFDLQWIMPRQFHVSPFNDRRGWYEIHLKAPPLDQDIQNGFEVNFLVIHHYPADDVGPTKTFTQSSVDSSTSGSVSLSAFHSVEYKNTADFDDAARGRRTVVKKLTAQLELKASKWQSAWMVATRYPLTLFLTFPRITWQAFLLAYRHWLPVYPRPMNLNQDTIEQTPLDGYSERCRDLVYRHLQSIVDGDASIAFAISHQLYGTVVISNAGNLEPKRTAGPRSPVELTMFEIQVASHEVWTWFHLLPDLATAIDLCVHMKWMAVDVRDTAPGGKDGAMDPINRLKGVLDRFALTNFGKSSFGKSLSQRVRCLLFRQRNVPSRHPLSRFLSSSQSIVFWLQFLMWLAVNVLLDLMTWWQVGYEPSPWSVWRRYSIELGHHTDKKLK